VGKVTSDMAMSIDGFVATPNQTFENPMGEGFDMDGMHGWMWARDPADLEAIDAITAAGAFIMGRNMFGPIRGEWEGDWTGWWGENPPYDAPVFVLTHYPREPLVMEGGTTFYFVTDGVQPAMEQARAVAGDATISIGGGADTMRQFLNAGLIDELRLHTSPVLLGEGERLFDGVRDLSLEPIAVTSNPLVTHTTYRVTYPGR
jgi:dihydrofolate reductase